MAAAVPDLNALPTHEWYRLDQRVRRVERAELQQWLHRVGDETFMDDLDHDEHLLELWDTMRCRNSHLVASLDENKLALAKYTACEVQVIIEALRGPIIQAVPAPVPGQSISVVMQPDPNADARSQAQLDAFTQAMQSRDDAQSTMMRDSQAERTKIDPFLDGENRRATVKETRSLLLQLSAKADRYSSELGLAYTALYSDPYAEVIGLVAGMLELDKKMAAHLRRILSPAQYDRYGGGVADSGVLMAQSLFQKAVEMEHGVFMALCSKLSSLGRTDWESAVPTRLRSFEDSVLEVRFSKMFALDTAVDMLSRVMSPMTEAVTKLNIEWMTGTRKQKDFDKLLTSASILAEAAGSNSTKPTPNEKVRDRSRFSRGPPNTSSRAPSNYSSRILGAGSEAPVQLRPGGGRSWNTGNASQSGASGSTQGSNRWRGGDRQPWRGASNQPQQRVNAITTEELLAVVEERAAENDVLREQMHRLQCNFMQLQYDAGLISAADMEGEREQPKESIVNGVVVAKVNMPKRQRAPTMQEKLRKQLKLNSEGSPNRVSALIDSCTDTSVTCTADIPKCSNEREISPVGIVSVTGTEVNRRAVDMPTVIGAVESRCLPKARSSIIAQKDILEKGYGVVALPGVGCGLVDVTKPEGHPDRVIECPPEGNCYRLPNETVPAARAVEMQRAERLFRRFAQRRRRMQTLQHARSHKPADMLDCDDCKGAGITKQPSTRKQPHRHRDAEFDGLDLSFDFITGMPSDNDGNTNCFVMEEPQFELGSVVPTKHRSEDETLDCFKKALQDIFSRLPMNRRVVRSVHSDNEKSAIFGKLMQYIRDNHWRQSRTEPYDHNGNARAEGRNRRLKFVWKAYLLHATGGRMYYKQCWGNFARYASEALIQSPAAGEKSPAERGGVRVMDIEKDGHVPGAKCYFWVPGEQRDANDDVPGRLAIWAGFSEQVPGGHRVIPAEWSRNRRMWVLQPTLHVKKVLVEDDVMLLRQMETETDAQSSSAVDFDAFVDRFSSDAATDDVHEMSSIRRHRTVETGGKQVLEYKVRWKGYGANDDTWEPEGHLEQYGAERMLKKYKMKTGLMKVNAVVCDAFTPSFRATIELMDRHQLEGSVSHWMAAYDAEFEKVKSSRLKELHGAERERVLKTEKVIRLRMNPEPKKVSDNDKMRLLVMGHTEPVEWNDGKCLDSPTLMASTTKLMIAMEDGTYCDQPVVEPDAVSSIISDTSDIGPVDGESEITTGDISSAFLTSPHYTKSEPPRYVGYREYKGGPLRVFRLLGSLYGQKDAPYRFYGSLSKFLLSLGFKQCRNDVCLYVHKQRRMLVGSHVDDVIARANRHQSLWFWHQMELEYKLKNWGFVGVGEPREYCALRISLQLDDGVRVYGMDQNADVSTFLRECSGLALRPVKAPMPDKHALEKDTRPATPPEQKWFKSRLMSVSFFAISSRFDVSQPVSKLAQKMAAPTVSAVAGLKRLIAYLMYRPELTLTVRRAQRQDNEYGFYVDSDHGGDQPYSSRSQTGIMLTVNDMPVEWRSNKQPVTALSSAAAEIYAFSEAVKHVNLLLWRAEEIGVKVDWPINIYEDNKATISFQKSTTPNTKLKGIYNLRWNWVVQLRNRKKYTAVKVGTNENKADMGTKCYTPADMTKMLKQFTGVVTKL